MSEDGMKMEEMVTDILMAITDVGIGDLSAEIEVDPEDNSPMAALALGINEMIVSLRTAADQAEKRRRELENQLETIRRQQDAINDLTTPILEVWPEVLVLPVVGILDTRRSLQMMDTLLHAIVQKQAAYVIVDITGVDLVDTSTADHLIKMSHAARLVGARCLLTGIQPAVAQTLVTIGIDMTTIETHRSLYDGLRECLRLARRQGRAKQTLDVTADRT